MMPWTQFEIGFKTREARELWEDAQNNHVAFGGVLDIADACESPQFAHRNFFKKCERVNSKATLSISSI